MYHVQELEPTVWKLKKLGLPETPTIGDYLNSIVPENSKIGVDPHFISKSSFTTIQNTLKTKGNTLESIEDNLIDKIWSDKPNYPMGKIQVHTVKYAGVSHLNKIQNIQKQMKDEKTDVLVIGALDEIAWLFNIRGNDVTYNPVVIAYGAILEKEAILYVDSNKLTEEVKTQLKEVTIKEYKEIFDDISKWNNNNLNISIDPIKCNIALFNRITNNKLIKEQFSPITFAKAIKNEIEIEGFRQCHIRDAAALITYFDWLEQEVNNGNVTINEVIGANKLDKLRSEQDLFVSLSFETISGYGSNGAIIHYKPEIKSPNCKIIGKDNMYLCDSGGQYRDGTTDVTRTIHIGLPTDWQKKTFTRVLQGFIALDRTIFPTGTLGNQLDVIARAPLWLSGLDYRHGTGHGVGSFLNVHEGPQGISFRESPYKVPLQPGMTVTNEPGYYEDGNFGIRIENVLIVKKATTDISFGGKEYYGFEHVTLVPIQTKLIDTSLLSKFEIDWINNYHQECLQKISPLLKGSALEWLRRETIPIS